jgi:hypothetical protein
MMPYLQNTNMACQACANTVSGDLDPTSGKFSVNIVFGNNFQRNSQGGGFSEAYIAGYKIHMVDAMGRNAQEIVGGDIKAAAQTTTCCNSNAYTISVSGDWNTAIESGAGGYFLIVPYSNETINNVVNTKVPLPLGTMTAKVNDVTTGTAVKIKQDVKMVMSEADANNMATDSSYNPVIIAAIVTALDNSLYLAQYFSILEKTVATVSTRRLDSSAGRRLVAHQTHELKVKYEALLPSSVPVITADTINTTKLTEAVNTESAKAGIPVTVASSSAENFENVGTVGSTTGTSTDGAHRVAGSILASFAAVLLTLLSLA